METAAAGRYKGPPGSRPGRTMLRTFALPFLLLGAPALAQAPEGSFAIRGARLIPVAGPELAVGTVLVRDGRIAALGAELEIPEGLPVLEAEGLVLMPGLVDVRSHLGFGAPTPAPVAGGASALDPALRAVDSLRPADPALRGARAGGVTTANLFPDRPLAVGGLTAYVKLRGRTVDRMRIDPGAQGGGLALGCGGEGEPALESQRVLLAGAREYREAWKGHRERLAAGAESAAPRRDHGLEVLVEVLDRRRAVHYRTRTAAGLAGALDLAEEFGLELVLHAEEAAVGEALGQAGRIASAGHLLSLALVDHPGEGPGERAAPWDALPQLAAAGVRLALAGGGPHPCGHRLLGAAALARRGGLGREAVLRALTLEPARGLDLEDRVGSLERGKHADLVLLSGDPLSIYTRVLAVWIEGRLEFDRARPADLADALGGGSASQGAAALDRPPVAPQVLLERRAVERPYERTSDLGARFAVEAEWLYTAAGPPISKGVVLVEDGRVSAVGAQGEVALPEGTPILRAPAVTPGLIDTHGAAGFLEGNALAAPPGGARGQNGAGANPARALPRAVDGLDPRDGRLAYLRSRGVTLVQASPRPGPALFAQAAIFRTYGATAQDLVVRRTAALVFDLSEGAVGTALRMDRAARLRSALEETRAWAAGPEASRESDPRLAALARILSGELPAIFVVERADEALTALRLAGEYDLRCVLSQAAEAFQVAGEIARAAAPVLVGPPAPGGGGPFHGNAAALAEAGVALAFASGFAAGPTGTCPVPAGAALAAVHGLGVLPALRALTLDAARLLGIEAERGSLERGKAADLVLWDGDPLEPATRVEVVVAEGRVIHDRLAPR